MYHARHRARPFVFAAFIALSSCGSCYDLDSVTLADLEVDATGAPDLASPDGAVSDLGGMDTASDTSPDVAPTPDQGGSDMDASAISVEPDAGGACRNDACEVEMGESAESCPEDCALAVQVSVGRKHACALLEDGSIRCWGENVDGQLGNNSTTPSSTPVKAMLPGRAAKLGLGNDQSCAILTNGTAACWGGNNNGELGLGHTDPVLIPSVIPGLSDLTDINGGDDYTCAWRALPAGDGSALGDGSAWCWGENVSGKLGIGSAGPSLSRPQPVTVVGPVRQLVAAQNHACATDESDMLWCWGSNVEGQLGDGTFVDRVTAVAPGVGGAVDIVRSEEDFACAVRKSDRKVLCWGANAKGQLGQPAPDSSSTPTEFPGFSNPFDLSVGFRFGCASFVDGSMHCWGEGDEGQRGYGGNGSSHMSAAVSNMNDAVSHASNGDTTCAIRTDRSVWCWGGGSLGQLGNGGMTNSTVPVPVARW